MDTKTLEELQADLKPILEKYGITSGAVCGSVKDHFFGGPLQSMSLNDFVITFVNIGRLWQWAKESQRKIMTDFEKGEAT